MNKAEAKKLWFEILDKHMSKSKHKGINLAPCVEKLKMMKFTYGGEMRAKNPSGSINKAYEYGWMHFPAIMKIYAREHAHALAGELTNGDKKAAEEITKNGFADNQCGLCGRISNSKWAFVKTHTRVRLSPAEEKKIQKTKATTVCRDRSMCRKKQDKKRARIGKQMVVTA